MEYESTGTSDFVRRSLIVLALAGLLLLVSAIFWHAAAVVLLLSAGILLAVALDAPADWLARHTPISRFWATGVVLLVIAGLVTAIWVAAGPSISRQFHELAEQLPQSLSQLRSQLETTVWGRKLLEAMPKEPQSLFPSGSRPIEAATKAFSGVLWAITATLVVVFTGLYLAFEPRLYISAGLRLLPKSKRDTARHVLSSAGRALRWWLVGRLGTMAVDGLLVALGLWLLGIPLALILGLVAALLAFIPNVGPILSFLPAAVIAFAQSPRMLLWVALLYLGVQFVESYLITPLILRKSVSLPPALVLTAQVLLGLVAGTLGLLVATPLAVVCVVVVQELYIQRVLHEPVKVLGEPSKEN